MKRCYKVRDANDEDEVTRKATVKGSTSDTVGHV
jgi:hypothetical protein